MDLIDYDYFLPKNNLALEPMTPRDLSKLFVYNTENNQITFDYFNNLDNHLPENSFLVLNNTKVLPARVEMKKQSGGKALILFLINEPVKSNTVNVMADRKINVGDLLFFDKDNFLKIIGQNKHIFKLNFNFSQLKLFDLLKKYGTMPIPLYLKKTPLKKDELLKKYQTIFAKKEGSSAAPTASLHFTDKVFQKLEKKGIEKLFITLHVGLGTFAPITNKNLIEKKLHKEYFELDKEVFKSINRFKKNNKKLVAVGTTVTRTLESLDRIKFNKEGKYFNKTDLFIFPPYNFKMVDILLTNFHLPKSSLMMLVEAFLRYKKARHSLVDLYNIAIKNNFRFYSFGDAMLIL